MPDKQDAEQLEAIIPDEELELDLSLDDTEDVEALKAQIEKDARIKRQLLARAKKAEFEKKEEAKPQKTLSKPFEDSILKDVAELKLTEKKRQTGYKLGLSPEETDTLFRFAGNEDPEEAFENPFFKAGLKEFRKEKSVQNAIPSSSNRTKAVSGKTFAEMTEAERKANWGKFTEA